MNASPPAQPLPGFDPAFYLAGPTGSGKSAVALALADRLRSAGIECAVINADAFQLYAGIEILSAAPTAEQRGRVPHHLYGALSLDEAGDAAHYAALARPLLDDLCSRNIRPLVVGGSGLYLKALTHGLAPTPPGDPDLRQLLDTIALADLVAWYQRIDAEGAAATNLQNRRYVTRNLEIALLSGQPASELKRSFATPSPRLNAVVLSRERSDLYDRINHRADTMFANGVIDEIRRLADAPLSSTTERAIGLREIRACIGGELSREETIERIRQATRRYAKRQVTWFKREKEFQSICLAADDTADSAAGRILSQLPPLLSAPSIASSSHA